MDNYVKSRVSKTKMNRTNNRKIKYFVSPQFRFTILFKKRYKR